ncbi:MAG: class I SAM-dependent methyltransferase [Bacteroidota bacterium]
MLTKPQKAKFRAELFRHLDGIAMAPVAYSLHKHKLLDALLKEKRLSIRQLCDRFGANEGYLNVALHLLCGQGWLEQELDNGSDDIFYSTNDRSAIAFALCHLYEDVVALIQYSGQFHKRKFERKPFLMLESIYDKCRRQYDLSPEVAPEVQAIQQQVLRHIEGMIVGPTTVALGMGGMFHKYFMEASFKAEEFHKDSDSFGRLLEIFVYLEWFEKKNNTYRFTDKGLFFAKRASAYGVTVSYIPTFRRMDDLLFGKPDLLWDVPAGSPEIHVDRAMNVWGSGGAHSTYFRKIDEAVISLFNRPIAEQPKGIVDMGCGNGAFLEHIFNVIAQRTRRGELLEEHPLFLVGADFNQAALKATRATLIQADIWAKVIWGDIGRPDLLADDLQENYGIDLGDLLNVRTFLDHNRIWEDPTERSPDRLSTSSGAFAHRGHRIPNNAVEDNLLQHFRKWAPYVRKFGLLVIELHTISPALIAENLGRTAATAYNATHGFSDQYILEIDNFLKVAAEAGLHPDPQHQSRFPKSELATVSINLLKGK